MDTNDQSPSIAKQRRMTGVWPRRMRIGVRLAVSFVIIVLLLLAANVVAFLQLRSVRTLAQHLALADNKLIAVLRVHSSLLAFREQLDSLAVAGDPQRFANEATQLQNTVLANIQNAQEILNHQYPGFDRDPTLLPTLQAVNSALPSQVNILSQLAEAGDWQAVRLRSDSQGKALSLLTNSVIDKVDSEVAAEQAQALQDIQRGERRVLFALSITALVTLLIAGVLGIVVTKSITEPLNQLGDSANALARGEFYHEAQTAGSDELTELSVVFNNAGRQLRQLYEDLRTSEARFRTVIETAPVGITVVAADGKVLFSNPTLLAMFGVTEQRLLQQSYSATVPAFYENGSPCPPEERPVTRVLATAQASRGQVLRYYRPTLGDWIWLLADAGPVFKPDGTLGQVVSTLTNITQQKDAEEALRRSEAEFRTVFDSAAIGMTLVDTNGHLIRANQAFIKLLQYSKEELEKLDFAAITHPDDVALSQALFQDLVVGKRQGYRLKKRYIRKDGEICWAWLNTSAMRHADGPLQYCVSMIEDITSQEKAHEELRQLSTRMLRVQEEEQRRVAREVHDSTSQEMTALALHLGALKKTETNLSPKGARLIGKCLALAQGVSREIRTFSYLLHPPMLDEFGLWAAVRVFVTEFRNRSGIQASVEIEPQIEDQRLDPSQEIALFRFVQEAFANVYRHSGSKTACVQAYQEAGSICLRIVDQGRGIPQKILKQINPFTGRLGSVGIPGMRERIMQIGGTLEIQSGKEGTVLCAKVPAQFNHRTRPGL